MARYEHDDGSELVDVGERRSARTVSLGAGMVVPYPSPLDDAASRRGQANRRKDTKPEVSVRSALHRRGLRFRNDLPVRCGEVRVRPDVVFTRRKVAVFVDGCFWHACPQHGQVPRNNVEYWAPKLRRNVERDDEVNRALLNAGWTVVRVWEHEDPESVAARVELAVNGQTGRRSPATSRSSSDDDSAP